jgi:putative Mg2+ transporter-C (MgtC) family protein
MLVCVGSCLIMIVSAFGFADVANMPNVVLDPSRVAAQVVSGIGFLGAGSIMLRGEVIRGLTTAASLWTVAGVGLAVGGGLYVPAGAATVLVLGILAGIKPFEERYRASRQTVDLFVQSDKGELSLRRLGNVLGHRTRRIKQFANTAPNTSELDEFTITLEHVSSREVTAIVMDLRRQPYIKSVREASEE